MPAEQLGYDGEPISVVAAVYRLLGQTEFAHENPESIDIERTLEATIDAMVTLLSTSPDDRYIS